MQTTVPPKARLFFLDNLRIYLTILVIFHHAALAYGGSGAWYVGRDPMTDEISPILLTLFNITNQSYFMSAFFLLAGYFTPISLERKGTKQFLIDRLIRLAIPILVFSTLIINLNGYILNTLYKGQARRWGIMSLVTIPLLPVILVLGVLGSDANKAKFLGGPYWQAFALIVWEAFLMVGVTVFLIYFFREKFNKTGPLAKSMAANVYTIYIVHATILFSLQILLMPVNIPTILKFLISGLLAVPVCYLVSILTRKIPYAKRVLG